jgi:hypothetical protein
MHDRLRCGCFWASAANEPNQPETDANDTPAAAIRKQSRRETMRHLNMFSWASVEAEFRSTRQLTLAARLVCLSSMIRQKLAAVE